MVYVYKNMYVSFSISGSNGPNKNFFKNEKALVIITK